MTQYTEENLVWTTLDAPKIEPENWEKFWAAWNAHAGASHITKSDPAGNIASDNAKKIDFFKGLNIYAAHESLLTDNHWEVPFLDYKEIFPNVLDDLHAAFPWAEVVFCRLWMSNVPIPMHRDHSTEPGALRAMIYNENKKPTFKVWNPRAGTNYVDLPEESNSFIYNNATCFHGSDRSDGVNKIILLVIHRTKDKDMLNEHLRKSAERFPDRCKFIKK